MGTLPWSGSRRRSADLLELPRAGREVGVEAAARLPSVMVLVVEDACTRIAYEDWHKRQPPRRHLRAHRRRRAEGRLPAAKTARLRALAEACLDHSD